MSEYIPDWDIYRYEEALAAGDREMGERLVRFYESEIASMAIRRDRALRALAELRDRPVFVEAEVVESYAIEA
jgi:hypothetical protein